MPAMVNQTKNPYFGNSQVPGGDPTTLALLNAQFQPTVSILSSAVIDWCSSQTSPEKFCLQWAVVDVEKSPLIKMQRTSVNGVRTNEGDIDIFAPSSQSSGTATEDATEKF